MDTQRFAQHPNHAVFGIGRCGMSRLELDPVGGILHGVAELSALQHGDIVVIVPESHGLRRRKAHAFLKFPERSALGDALGDKYELLISGDCWMDIMCKGITKGANAALAAAEAMA